MLLQTATNFISSNYGTKQRILISSREPRSEIYQSLLPKHGLVCALNSKDTSFYKTYPQQAQEFEWWGLYAVTLFTYTLDHLEEKEAFRVLNGCHTLGCDAVILTGNDERYIGTRGVYCIEKGLYLMPGAGGPGLAIRSGTGEKQ
jgi:hypothetical protein